MEVVPVVAAAYLVPGGVDGDAGAWQRQRTGSWQTTAFARAAFWPVALLVSPLGKETPGRDPRPESRRRRNYNVSATSQYTSV